MLQDISSQSEFQPIVSTINLNHQQNNLWNCMTEKCEVKVHQDWRRSVHGNLMDRIFSSNKLIFLIIGGVHVINFFTCINILDIIFANTMMFPTTSILTKTGGS